MREISSFLESPKRCGMAMQADRFEKIDKSPYGVITVNDA